MEHTQEFPSHNTLKTCGSNEKRLLMKDKFNRQDTVDQGIYGCTFKENR